MLGTFISWQAVHINESYLYIVSERAVTASKYFQVGGKYIASHGNQGC